MQTPLPTALELANFSSVQDALICETLANIIDSEPTRYLPRLFPGGKLDQGRFTASGVSINCNRRNLI